MIIYNDCYKSLSDLHSQFPIAVQSLLLPDNFLIAVTIDTD